jgi:hypothetical protein
MLKTVPRQAADFENVTLINMGIQSHGDYGQKFITLRPAITRFLAVCFFETSNARWTMSWMRRKKSDFVE